MCLDSRKLVLIIILFVMISPVGFGKDIKVDAAALGGLKARMVGPAVMSGRITAIDCVTKDPRTMYIGTADGGVWKSVDGGVTVKQVFKDHTMSIGCLTIDPGNPETVWVGTGECNVRNSVSVGTGLYVSKDGGKEWKFMGFKDSERISKILVDPKDSKTVYVGVMGHLWNANKERGVYKSTDEGKTWEQILFVDDNTGCADLEMDPQETGVLYAAMWEFRRKPYFFTSGGKGSGLYKSTDKGKTWKKLQKGLPKGNLGRIAVAVAPSRPGTLYAQVEAKETALYRSNEMGENWEMVNDTRIVKMRPFYFSHLIVDPKDHNRVYVANYYLGVSEDGGKNFSFQGGVHPDLHALWVNPDDPNTVIVGTDGGVYISNNKGNSFTMVASLPISQFYHVSYDMRRPYNVYGGLQDNGSWYGPSMSFSGRGIRNGDWKNVGIGDGFYVFRHSTDPDIIYYNWQGGRVVRYNERTEEAKNIKPLPTKKGEPKYRFNWNAAVALSPTDPEILYMGGQFLFKSLNRGDTWEKISPDLTTDDSQKQQQQKSGGLTIDNTTAENHCTIFTICQSPLEQNLIWVGTDDGNLQVTRDGGKTWKNVVINIPGLPKHTWCSSVEAGHYKPGTAYATFDGHRTGDMKPYVYKTGDFGKTWKPLAGEAIEGYCHIIREDLVNPDLLFLGTEFGLFVTIDGGKQWAHLKEALPKVSVRDLAIHPREHDLIIATHGLGIQIIDDITPLRALTPEILNTPASVLPSRPAFLKTRAMHQSFPGNSEFSGGNPPSGAVITYYLKKRHIFGDLKLEIVDASGEIIQTLPTSKRRGINRIYWGMRSKPPKMPTSPGLPRYYSLGPQVAEGTYTARLVKMKKVYPGKIEVMPDPIAAHSKEDRELRHKTVMKLYNLQEELGYVADCVFGIVKEIDKRLKDTKNKNLKNRLKKYKTRLDDFHKTLILREDVATEAKLMGKVAGLYTEVIQYGGKPTDSQVYHYSVLKDKVKEVEAVFKKLMGELPGINASLEKKGLPLLKRLTKEEYKNKK